MRPCDATDPSATDGTGAPSSPGCPGWTVSRVLVTIGTDHGWVPAGVPAVAASVIPAACGIVMIVVHRRFLREAGELRRKIELDACALAAGVEGVGTVTHRPLEQAGAIREAGPVDVVVAMVVAHTIGVVIGERRYA